MFFLAAPLFSCNIKENRIDCPAEIVVTISATGEVESDSAVSVWVWDANAGCVGQATRTAAEFFSEGVVFPVKKESFYRVTCACGLEGTEQTGTLLSFPQGSASCPFAGFSQELYIGSSEYGYEVVGKMARSHAKVTLNVLSDDEDYPFRFALNSGTVGISAYDFTPVVGEREYVPSDAGFLCWETAITRQADFSLLTMDVFRAGNTKADGTAVHTISIGRDLLDAGYDPWAEDMEDIVIEVTYAEGGIRLKVNGWEIVYDGEYGI